MADRCGFCHPPAEDSHDREVIDRFRAFLNEAGPAPKPGEPYRLRSHAHRYRVKYLAWRTGWFAPWDPTLDD